MQIKGNFMIELFNEEENPKRVGGAVALKDDKYQFFSPKLAICHRWEEVFI